MNAQVIIVCTELENHTFKIAATPFRADEMKIKGAPEINKQIRS